MALDRNVVKLAHPPSHKHPIYKQNGGIFRPHPFLFIMQIMGLGKAM